MEIVGGALRTSGRLKNRPLVLAQHIQPAIDIARAVGPRLEFRDDTQIGAEEGAAEFGSELFAGTLGTISVIPGQVAVKPARRSGAVRHLVAEDSDIGGVTPEGLGDGALKCSPRGAE